MAENKERLVVEADVSSVTQGSKTLDQFVSSSVRAGASVDNFGDKAKAAGDKAASGAGGQKKLSDAADKATKSHAEAAAAADKQSSSTSSLKRSVDDTAKTIESLRLAQSRMTTAAQSGLVVNRYAAEYNETLERQIRLLQQKRTETNNTSNPASAGSASDSGSASLAESQSKVAKETAAATIALNSEREALSSLLDKIKPTRAALKELEDQKASLLKAKSSGLLSEDETTDYATILESRRKVIEKTDAALAGLNTTSTKQKTLQQGLTISTGQYRNALNMLPAQMTDIVTQLAGGQNPFLIMIQQGGQIKDSFGGLKNTFTALKQYITPSFLGTTTAVAAIAGLGYAAYDAGERVKEMTRSVLTMGGSGYSSVKALSDSAKTLANEMGGTVGEMTSRLVSLNDKGKYTQEQMEKIATAMAKFGQAGNDEKEALSGFDKIYDDPVKGLAKLNEQYGFVTESQMKHIIQTKKSKGEYAASQEAIDLWADSVIKRSDDVIEKTDGVGKAWRDMKNTASEIFDGLGVTIRAWANEGIAGIQAVGAAFKVLLADSGVISEKLSVYLLEPLVGLMEKIPGVGNQISQTLRESIETSKANISDYSKRSEDANKDYQKYSTLAMMPQSWHEEQVRNGDGASASGATSNESRKTVTKLAEKSNNHAKTSVDLGERMTEQYEAQAVALQSQIAIFEHRSNFDQNASSQQKDYLMLQAKINILEKIKSDEKGRALTKDEKSLLANKDQVLAQAKIVASYGDRLQKMQKEAQISDELKRSQNDIAAKVDVIRQSWGMSADEAQRLMENAQRAAALKDKGATDEQVSSDLSARNSEKDAVAAKTQDWAGGAKTALQEWGKSATDYSSIAKSALGGAMDAGLTSMNEFVTKGKTSFADFTKSVLSMIVSIINKLLIMKAIQAAGSAMGYDMSFMGSGSKTANAKGGVYDSPSLSAFSNGVYSSPQNFSFSTPTAFAKGGVFGEAGPEAIMPLSRDSSGRLGVVAQSGATSGGGSSIGNVNVYLQSGESSSDSDGDQRMGKAYGEVITQGANEAIEKSLQPGGKIWQAQNGHA